MAEHVVWQTGKRREAKAQVGPGQGVVGTLET